MQRIAIFLGTIAVSLAGVAGLNWWMDPLADQYHARFLSQALAQNPPCSISWAVLRPRSWGAYKLDLAKRTPVRTAVVGTSRVAKISAWPGEHGFVNLGSPGLGAQSLPDLFARVHGMHPGPLVMYVDADIFWFGTGWRTATWFNTSRLRDLKYLLAPSTTVATIRLLRYAPGAVRHPQQVLYTEIDRRGGRCMVDRGNTVYGGSSAAWAPDGSVFFAAELQGRRIPGAPLIDLLRPEVVGTRMTPSAVSALDRALVAARSYGWTVVGFAPPFSPTLVRRLGSESETRDLYHDYQGRVATLFERHGFRFLNLTDIRSIPCSPHDFSPDDGGHPDIPCSHRIRRKLDAAAPTPRSAP
jgi:hypothetical protein